MAWCEANGVDFVLGLQKNERLIAAIKDELVQAEAKSASGRRYGFSPAAPAPNGVVARVARAAPCASS